MKAIFVVLACLVFAGCGGGGRAILNKVESQSDAINKLDSKVDRQEDTLRRIDTRLYYIQTVCGKSSPQPPPPPAE